MSKLFVPVYRNTAKRTWTVWKVMKNALLPHMAHVELEHLEYLEIKLSLEVIS